MAEIKPAYDTKRTYLKDVVPLPQPYSINVEITSACNFKCFYCVRSVRSTKEKDMFHMDMDLYDKFVRDIMAFSEQPKKILLAGIGEPLMNPNAGRMLKMLREAGYTNKLWIITNGSLLSRERSEELVDSGLTHMLISVQGLSPERYKKNCGVEIDFEKYVENIRYLYEISRGKVEIYVKIIDALLTEVETEELFYNTFDGICDRIYVEHLQRAYRHEHGVETDKRFNRYNELIVKERKVCPVPFYLPGIYADGNVSPCCQFMPPKHCIGNLKTQSFKDIWNGEKHVDFLKRQLIDGYRKTSTCSGCEAADCILGPEEDIDGYSEEILARLEKLEEERNG